MRRCDFEEKSVMGAAKWREFWGGGWEGERGVHRGSCKGNSSKPLTGKTRGADYLECLQPVELKAWSFRVPYHGWCGVQRALQFSYGEGGQKPGNRWH